MEKRTLFSISRTVTLCSALCGIAGCGGDGSGGGTSAARAALAAECSDPTLIVESQTLKLWPPNHKFHDVTVDQCISAIGGCEGTLTGEFIYASSDEPIDDLGDGHFAPDIGLGIDTGHVCVRSERQGPEDGRVYTLGVRVTDADGNVVERECVVIVDHDQRGVTGVDSGDAYTIQFDPADAGLDCEGNPPTGDAGSGGTSGGAGDSGGAGNGGDPCTDADGCDQAGTGGGGEAGSGEAGSGEAGSGGSCPEPEGCPSGEAGSGDEGTAGSGDGEAGSGDEGAAGSGDGNAGSGDDGSAGGGDLIPSDGGPD